jgi:hypothetical protein
MDDIAGLSEQELKVLALRLQPLPFGFGRPAAVAPEAGKLLTPDEISPILGEEIEPCEQRHHTAAQDDTYKADRRNAIFTGTDRGDGVPSPEIDITPTTAEPHSKPRSAETT